MEGRRGYYQEVQVIEAMYWKDYNLNIMNTDESNLDKKYAYDLILMSALCLSLGDELNDYIGRRDISKSPKYMQALVTANNAAEKFLINIVPHEHMAAVSNVIHGNLPRNTRERIRHLVQLINLFENKAHILLRHQVNSYFTVCKLVGKSLGSVNITLEDYVKT